jgi:transposase-like protein
LIVLPIEGIYTVEEQRQLVYDYLCVPHGSKGQFLVEHGVSSTVLRRWRKMVFAGSVEHGLVPRGGAMVSVEETQALKKLLEENRALKDQLACRDVEHQQELASRDDELAIQRRTVDALGKAIEILHRSGSKNSTSSAAHEHEPPEVHRNPH